MNHDVKVLSDFLVARRFREREDAQTLPSGPNAQLPGLNELELAEALRDSRLRNWEPWEEVLPHEYPRKRQELRRSFDFSSFKEAIEFMAFLMPRFDGVNHHPRWGNEWRRVQVRLTTWAGANRITHIDVEVATLVEDWYREFKCRAAGA